MSIRTPVKLYYPRGSVIVTPPAIEPVTADQFRAHIVDSTLSDTEALVWITAARQYIEDQCNIAMITQVWRVALDNWPQGQSEWWDGVRVGSITELYGPSSYSDVAIPRFPLQAVDSVTTYDVSDDATVVDVAETFTVDTYRRPARMALRFGETWPTNLRDTNAIIIDYTCGYGDAAADVPAPLSMAVNSLGAYMYSNRGDGCTAADAFNGSGAAALVGPYKSVRI